MSTDRFGAAADALELLEAEAGALWKAAACEAELGLLAALPALLDMNALLEEDVLLPSYSYFEDCEVEIRLLCISL